MRRLLSSACTTRCRSPQQHLPAAARFASNTRHSSIVPAASRRTDVVELVVLLQSQQGVPEEVTEEAVRELWSLQYRNPGVLTASGGTVQYPSPSPAAGNSSSSPASPDAPSSSSNASQLQPLLLNNTHAVHFRFASLPAAKALLRSSLLQAAAGGKSLALVGATVGSGGSAKGTANSGTSTRSSSSTGGNAGTDGDSGLFSRSTVLAFTGSIESDVDALFRRTEDYATGQDLLLVMRGTLPTQQPSTDSNSQSQGQAAQSVPAPVAEFLKQLGLLAQSSIAGAVQVSYGPVAVFQELLQGAHGNNQAPGNGANGHSNSSSSATGNTLAGSDNLYALLARFPSMRQLQAFRTSQPVAALWQQRRVLLESGSSTGGSTQGAAPVLPLYAEAELLISAEPSLSSREGLGRVM